MPWKYILSVRLDDNVIYKRDIDNEEVFIDERVEELYSINNTNYETLANVEVLKHGRKR